MGSGRACGRSKHQQVVRPARMPQSTRAPHWGQGRGAAEGESESWPVLIGGGFIGVKSGGGWLTSGPPV